MNMSKFSIFKKAETLVLIFILFFITCVNREHSNPLDPQFSGKGYSVKGYCQKGPFLSGSKVSIKELTDNLEYTGFVYETEINNALGYYELTNRIQTKYVEMTVAGYYFNEVSGSISKSPLELNVFADLSLLDTININLLTTLASKRVKYLISNNNSFEMSRRQAQNEVLKILFIPDTTSYFFEQMNINQYGNHNGILLALSLIFQGKLPEEILSELISKISTDIETDGFLNDTDNYDILNNNVQELNLTEYKLNLARYYRNIGATSSLPECAVYIENWESFLHPSIQINNNKEYTSSRNVILTVLAHNAHEMLISNNHDFLNAIWEPYCEHKDWILPTGPDDKIVYLKVRNAQGNESSAVDDTIKVEPLKPCFQIANGDKYSTQQLINIHTSDSSSYNKLVMKVSEDSTFTNVEWSDFASNFQFLLSENDDLKKVFFKSYSDEFKIESPLLADSIILDTTPPVANFTIIPDTGLINKTYFLFDAISSNDNLSPAEDIEVQWDWDEDGVYDTQWSNFKNITHLFSVGGGIRNIKVKARDAAGLISTDTKQIYVNTLPDVNFAWSSPFTDSTSIQFDATTSSDYEDQNDLQLHWDFNNDGVWDTDWQNSREITYKFPYFDTWHTKLEVKDKAGYTNSSIQCVLNSYITLGDSVTCWGDPFWTKFTHHRTQTIYKSSEIADRILINKIAFNICKLPKILLQNFTIKMKHTQMSYFATSFSDNDLSTCFNGNIYIDETGWFAINLRNPFLYNGKDNLLIEFSFTNSKTDGFAGGCEAINRGIGSSINYNGEEEYISSYVLNIRLYYYPKNWY